MGHYCSVIENDIHRSLRDIPGTGAAGGFSLPLLAYCNAELSHGIDSVLDIVGFYEAIKTADLVITGEGRTDEQSIHGKVISGVGQACMARNIPCIDITGGMGDGAEEVLKVGITSIVTTVNGIMSIKEAVKNCDELLYGAADRMFRLIKIGKAI
jgi:glycerate kinase